MNCMLCDCDSCNNGWLHGIGGVLECVITYHCNWWFSHAISIPPTTTDHTHFDCVEVTGVQVDETERIGGTEREKKV